MDESKLSTCVPDDTVVDSAELINNELTCFNRWLKSNKISINADKTKSMLFSFYENSNFPTIKIGNNEINEASVTIFLGIHLDKQRKFVNHKTEMSMKIAKSIALLHKLNIFIPETVLKKLYIHYHYSSIQFSYIYIYI